MVLASLQVGQASLQRKGLEVRITRQSGQSVAGAATTAAQSRVTLAKPHMYHQSVTRCKGTGI